MKIKILVDTCSDINKELLLKYQFGLVPISVNTSENSNIDNLELGCKEFCNYLRQCKEIPTTSQPSLDEFMDIFKRYEDEYTDIVFVTMSDAGSGTYSGAVNATNIYKEERGKCNIHVVNSKNTSLGMLHLTILLKKLLDSNETLDNAIKQIEEQRLKISAFYLIENVDFLVKSGRVSTIKGGIASTLNIKPIVQIKDGVGQSSSNALGIDKGLRKLASYFEKYGDISQPLYITHADCDSRSKKLKEMILKTNNNVEVIITEMNKPMSVHGGPGSIGLFYTNI
ncbi:MAG: DegV family protein [Oscillospiraceae bacterium]